MPYRPDVKDPLQALSDAHQPMSPSFRTTLTYSLSDDTAPQGYPGSRTRHVNLDLVPYLHLVSRTEKREKERPDLLIETADATGEGVFDKLRVLASFPGEGGQAGLGRERKVVLGARFGLARKEREGGRLTSRSCHTIGRTSLGIPDQARRRNSATRMVNVRRACRSSRWVENTGDG